MAISETELTKALIGLCVRTQRETGYNPTGFKDMLFRAGGGRQAIKDVLRSNTKVPEGYTRLFEKGRLDLTVEAQLLAHPEWQALFAPEELAKARSRLVSVNYAFPAQDQVTLPVDEGVETDVAGTNWTPNEVRTCVDAYLAMLGLEVAGIKYSKIEFNRQVQTSTGRSKGSVEFKFQNISAVLNQFGLRWIQGYKPATNAQTGAIQEALDEALAANAPLAQQIETQVQLVPLQAIPVSTDDVFADPPPRSPSPTAKIQAPPGTAVRKFDWAQADAGKRDLGRAGEQFVLDVEKQWLRANGKADLAASVAWISDEQGDGAGYDIASFELDGSRRLIEVKTTKGPATMPFLVSANEVEFSRTNPDEFWLYRVYNFGGEPRIYRERGP